MIAHVSLPSRHPQATATVLARLIDGTVFPFPVVEGAWIAIANDGSGTAFEVYPPTMAHHPGQGEADDDQIHPDGEQLRPHAFHVALSSPLDDAAILAIARDAGLRAVPCERGGVFGLIEVWLDEYTLIEVLSPRETARYAAFMNPQTAAGMFGPGIRAAA